MNSLSVLLWTVVLLIGSNLFMTFAWCGHLKTLAVVVPFAVVTRGQPFKPDVVSAGLCLVGTAFFIFRN